MFYFVLTSVSHGQESYSDVKLIILSKGSDIFGECISKTWPKVSDDLKTKFVLLMLVLIQTKSEKTLLSAKTPF